MEEVVAEKTAPEMTYTTEKAPQYFGAVADRPDGDGDEGVRGKTLSKCDCSYGKKTVWIHIEVRGLDVEQHGLRHCG